MSWIVIEAWLGAEGAAICVNEEDGQNKVFENEQDAQAEADKCQDGLIVEIR